MLLPSTLFLCGTLEDKDTHMYRQLGYSSNMGHRMAVFCFHKGGTEMCLCFSGHSSLYTSCVMLCNGFLEHIDVYSLCKSKDANQRQNQSQVMLQILFRIVELVSSCLANDAGFCSLN